MSEVIPASWQKACIGAVRKYVNWLPLPIDSAPGMADAILGERSKAAGSPFSASCMAWQLYNQMIIRSKKLVLLYCYKKNGERTTSRN